MKIPADFVVRQFLRTYLDAFSIDEFRVMLNRIGVKNTKEECVEFLDSDESVFALANGMYITRASAFTGKYFSFKPSRKEIEQGMFIIGHRCMPFVDPDILSCAIQFRYKGKLLSSCVGEYDSSFALEHYTLYGEEFSTQYIAADPANAGLDLAALDFSLPPKVNLTGINMEPLFQDGFTLGDRLLCRVVNWDENIVEVSILRRNQSPFQMTLSDVGRENWYKLLETILEQSFDAIGPTRSIEEQLAIVFADRHAELCIRNCGSIEKLFSRTKKIDFELFGVETRLWHKGQDVPAVGRWNSRNLQEAADCIPSFGTEILAEPLPQFMLDSCIRDQIYKGEKDFEKIFHDLYPNFYRFPAAQQKLMLLNIKSRHDILSRRYNRFADFNLGSIRHKALELFVTVNDLVCAIDMAGTDLTRYPQQQLVILSQIFGHVMRLIDSMENEPAAILNEINEVDLSIEGMSLNFEGICGDLKRVLESEARNGFSVI